MKDRKFLEARLASATLYFRARGFLDATQQFAIQSTGGDRLPYRVVVETWERADDGTVTHHSINREMTTPVDKGGLVAAVDALYNAGWLLAD